MTRPESPLQDLVLVDTLDPRDIQETWRSPGSRGPGEDVIVFEGGGFYIESVHSMDDVWRTEISTECGQTRRPYISAKRRTRQKPSVRQIRSWASTMAKGVGYA